MVSIQAIWLFFFFCFQLNKRKEKEMWILILQLKLNLFMNLITQKNKERVLYYMLYITFYLWFSLFVLGKDFHWGKKNNTYLSKRWYYSHEIIVKIMGIAVPFFRQQFIENAEIVRIQIHRNKNKWYHNQTYLNMFEIIIRQMSHICMQMCGPILVAHNMAVFWHVHLNTIRQHNEKFKIIRIINDYIWLHIYTFLGNKWNSKEKKFIDVIQYKWGNIKLKENKQTNLTILYVYHV